MENIKFLIHWYNSNLSYKLWKNPVRCGNTLNLNCLTMEFHICDHPITWNIRTISSTIKQNGKYQILNWYNSNCHTNFQEILYDKSTNLNWFTMKFHNCHNPITWKVRIINNQSLGLFFACAWTFVFEAVSTFVVTFRTTFFCSQTRIAFDRYPTTASRWICRFYCSLRMCRSGKKERIFSLATSCHARVPIICWLKSVILIIISLPFQISFWLWSLWFHPIYHSFLVALHTVPSLDKYPPTT